MKVTVTYEIPEIGIEMLQKKFDVEVNRKDRNMTHDELIEAAKTSDGILTVLSDKIDRDVLEAGRGKLKIVSNYAVGFNNIDLETAGKLGIKVSNTPGVLSDTTAELAWALLMSVSRRIAEGDRMVREGKFRGSKPKMLLGSDVYGKTLGIIGMGRIGQAFAKRAEGFGMNILYHNRKQLDKITEEKLGAHYTDLETLIKESDFISLHTPLTDETRHILNRERLDLVKKTAYIINTSRGACIDENYLYEKLKNRSIAGAGLDVYEFEPEITKGLTDLENVVLTPHIGSASIETRNRMSVMSASDIINVLEGKTQNNPVI